MKLICSIVVIANLTYVPSAMADANKICLDAFRSGRVRSLMMNQSESARLAMLAGAWMYDLPNAPKQLAFSQMVALARKTGPKQLALKIVAPQGSGQLCIQNKCFDNAGLEVLRSNAEQHFATLIELHDNYYDPQNVIATAYDPYLSRATCQLNMWIDTAYLRRKLSSGDEQGSKSIQQTELVMNAMKAAGQPLLQRYTVQPDGMGGTTIVLLAAP